MILYTVCVGSPDAFSAKKRAYSSTPVGFPIRYDLSAHSQGISEVFPTWERTRRAPTYVRGLVIAYDSTSNHQPQDHTTRSNHLSNTTQSPLKPRTKPYTAPYQNQSNTRLSTPLRALIFAQIHPIFVEICLGFAWDSLEVVHNQFNTHSTQLAYSFKPTESSLANRVSTIESSLVNRVSTIESSLVNRVSTIESSLVNQVSTIESSLANRVSTIESSLANRVSTIESKINRITLHDYLTSPSSPLSPRHQADSITTPSRLIHDTKPTNQGQQADSTWTNQGHQADPITTPSRLNLDKSRTPSRLNLDKSRTPSRPNHDTKPTQLGQIKDTKPTQSRHQAD